MKKIKQLSRLAKSLVALLGVFSVTKSSAADLFKKFRLNHHRSHNKRNARANFSVFGSENDHLFTSPFSGSISGSAPSISGFEKVSRIQQKVESATILGTWVQTVYDSQGETLYQAGEVLDAVPSELREKVKSMRGLESEVLENLRWASADFRASEQNAAPQIEVSLKSDQSYTAEWVVDFMNGDETKMLRAFISDKGHLKGIKEIGSGIAEGIGSVFPKGPRAGNLENVTLQDLDGSGHLVSESMNVKTALPQEAVSPQLDFRFQPQDARFDQVQAYFYADQILKFFKTKFDASPITQVELKVQVGDHSNSAFYYGSRIRIGSGDGTKYQNLAQDPSVVMHEVGHSIVDRYAGLPSDGEGGSLNEAFADFFAATLLENPRMGESSYMQGPYIRTLENNYRAPADLGGGLYKASQVVSGTFWDIRQALGPAAGENLAFKTLCRLGMGGVFKDFVPSVLAAAADLSAAEQAKVKEILAARGWDVNPS